MGLLHDHLFVLAALFVQLDNVKTVGAADQCWYGPGSGFQLFQK